MRTFKPTIFIVVLLLAAGCGGTGNHDLPYTKLAASVSPAAVSAFGHELLIVTSERGVFVGDFRVTVAGNEVYDVTVESPRKASFRWQGSEAERAGVDIVSGGTWYRIENALRVSQPSYPAFRRMFGFGASFGQGVVSMGFDQDTQIHAPSAQIAKQVGAYFPLPLTKRGYLPFIQPDDFDADCRLRNYDDKLIHRIDEALGGFLTEDGDLAPRGLRIDPDIAVQNASVGGSTLEAVLHGGVAAGMPVLAFLEHLVYDADIDWEGMIRPPNPSNQIDYGLALEPTLWITADIAGNDVLPALGSSGFNADRIPNDEYFHSLYRELFERIGSEPYVFIADLPDITLIPDVRERRRKLIAGGRVTEAVDAELQSVRERLEEVNVILAQEAKAYPRVVIVPFSERLDEMAEQGLTIGGVEFSVHNFGGFISLDSLHLTRVGYAVLANLFIEHINATLGTAVAPVDLEEVAKNDPETPDKLAPYGLTPAQCGE